MTFISFSEGNFSHDVSFRKGKHKEKAMLKPLHIGTKSDENLEGLGEKAIILHSLG